MKILSTPQIREADAYTIMNEPVSSVDLMERAATAIFKWFFTVFPASREVKILAGPGNNGGDGLALARMLIRSGYRTKIWILKSNSGYSPDTSVNLERLRAMNIDPAVISSPADFPSVEQDDIVVDALYGTGLKRPLNGLPAQLIDYLNGSGAEIVSIDIPSGLYGDDNRNNYGNSIIHASTTLSFQFPKLAFMFAENEIYIGSWKILPIGLHEGYISDASSAWHYVDKSIIKPLIRLRRRHSHKGSFGHSLLMAGSHGKMGAAVLSASSCLRSGAGLVTVHAPSSGCNILQTAIPEAMVIPDGSASYLSHLPDLSLYSAIAAGPGIGKKPETARLISELLDMIRVPLVLDADALNIIAMNRELIDRIPEKTIITPHPGEFDRLAGQHKTSHDRLISQVEMARDRKMVIVLKGAYTSIAMPDGSCYFNSTGNQGMATAGSGDVLTGILLSLLGQGYTAEAAALAGVYLHGLAGDIASETGSEESLIAGDITSCIGKAFKKLKQ